MGSKISKRRVLLLMGILTVGIIFISQLPPMAFTSFEWGVSVGDELIFNISTAGLIGFGWSSLQWTHLNNTVIIANITYLPNLQSFYTSHSFVSDVVNFTKVSCRFENGTSIIGYDQIVASLISISLLPINSWNELDSLFLDDYLEYSTSWRLIYTWVSRFEEDYFFFGHQGSSAEGRNGWKALVNMTTGIPIVIEDYDYLHGGYEILRMEFQGFRE